MRENSLVMAIALNMNLLRIINKMSRDCVVKITCDRCGRNLFINMEHSCEGWDIPENLSSVILSNSWSRAEGKHICPSCMYELFNQI